MAVYTILTNAAKSNRSDVIIEFPVPASDNTVGVPWQTIVAELRDEAGSVNPRKLGDAAYLAKLDAGEVYELALSVEYDAGLTDGEKLALLNAAVAEKVAEFTTEFAALYEFYGFEGGS